MITIDTDTQKLIAEELRLMHKELRWATAHLANIYKMLRTDDEPIEENPNQLNLFEDIKKYEKYL